MTSDFLTAVCASHSKCKIKPKDFQGRSCSAMPFYSILPSLAYVGKGGFIIIIIITLTMIIATHF